MCLADLIRDERVSDSKPKPLAVSHAETPVLPTSSEDLEQFGDY